MNPHEHASTILTSNNGVEQWREARRDDVMAAGLIDRTLHRCHLVNIRGNSYRMREHTELYRPLLQSDVEDSAEMVRRPPEAKCGELLDKAGVQFSSATTAQFSTDVDNRPEKRCPLRF